MVTVEVLDHGGVIFTTHISPIPRGGSLGASFAVHGDSPHVLTCIADADMSIAESNEDNNTLTATFQ
jgi:subtilase family serine protease